MNWARVWAIAARKFSSIKRDRRMFAFIVLMPAIQILLFGYAMGATPTDLNVITVGEHPILDELADSEYLIITSMADVQTARDAVDRGDAWAVIEANGSEIILHFDASNQQVMATIQKEVQTAVQASMGQLPISQGEVIHGEQEPEFIDFLAPGIMVLVCFMFSIILTTMAFVGERNDGTLDRLFAAGVTPIEVLSGHIAAFSVVLVGQVAVVISLAIGFFDIPMKGSIILLFCLALLLGWASMCLGLLISTKADSEFKAMQLTMPLLFPVLLLSGILWPVEALPIGLSQFSQALPTTWAAEAFRSIMMRGWGLEAAVVWKSFLYVGTFGLLMLLGAARSLRIKT